MAIWWIDPHTNVNGDGSYASPWSFQSTIRTGLASGDEVRIKAVELTNLLTATEYTATYTSWYQLTINAGGGLGADFSANDIIYLPQEDVFVKISAVSTNTLAVPVGGMIPWYDTSTGQTSIQVRKVDLSTYSSGSFQTATILNNNTVSDVTVTDGWISETVRVTDGSAKSIVNTTTTAAVTFFPLATNSSLAHIGTGTQFDLPNTALFQGNGTSSNFTFYVTSSNTTMDLGQFQSSSTSGVFRFGATTLTSTNVTIKVKHALVYNRILNNNVSYATNLDLELTNVASIAAGGLLLSSTTLNSLSSIINFTLTIGKVVSRSSGYLNLFATTVNPGIINLNFNGVMDLYNSGQALVGLVWAVGRVNVSFGPGFAYYHNRRTVEQTSINRLLDSNLPSLTNTGVNMYLCDPPPLPTGWSVSSNTVAFSQISYNSILSDLVIRPTSATISSPITISNTNPASAHWSTPNNMLYTFRDGETQPFEVLGVANYAPLTTFSSSQFPILFRDIATVRTSGPSLRSTLSSRNSAIWDYLDANVRPVSKKIIVVPIASGTTYNIEGYIRTNMATYANGDCNIGVYLNDDELDSQTITTNSIDNWEQFTLSFTANTTAEAYISWSMYYPASGYYWLDDLGISTS